MAVLIDDQHEGAAPPGLGEIVRFHRRAAGLTQAGLARVAGVGKTAVFDIEHGKPSIRLDTLSAVLDALSIRLRVEAPLGGVPAGRTRFVP